jgi:hypothetical protein
LKVFVSKIFDQGRPLDQKLLSIYVFMFQGETSDLQCLQDLLTQMETYLPIKGNLKPGPAQKLATNLHRLHFW